MNTEEKIEFVKKCIIGFIIVFLMTYLVVKTQLTFSVNDYAVHAEWAGMLRIKKFGEYLSNVISYPLWHLMVKILESKFAVNIYSATAFVTALFNGFTFISVLFVWRICHEAKVRLDKMIFWAVCLLIVNPLYAPWINRRYYLGQSAPNIWHNPTHIAVRGFAVIVFGLVILLLKRKEHSKNLLIFLGVGITSILSLLAKPSFLQGFLPGLFLFIILRIFIEKRNFNIKFYLKLCVVFLPCICLMLFQIFATFFNTDFIRSESHISIGWGEYLYTITSSVLGSFIISFAFPIFVLLINYKSLIHKEDIQLMLCYEAATWLEAVLLYEKGEAFAYGNFTWGYLVSSFIVWMTMVYYFIHNLYLMENKEKNKKIILLSVGGGDPIVCCTSFVRNCILV